MEGIVGVVVVVVVVKRSLKGGNGAGRGHDIVAGA